MKNKLLIILLITYFIKELFWSAIIPIWHFPDEEQHFGQVAFWAELKRAPQGAENDINKEIDNSSIFLGTKRDGWGVNKFTYHPEYRIEYSQNQNGIKEEEIKGFNTTQYRNTMVKREAARYGPVFYILTAIPYRVFYNSDLFIRVFASRFLSIILSTINIFLIFQIAKTLFKSKFFCLTLTGLVAFQPMFSFVSAGINSDNLFNLIFTLILFYCLKIFFSKERLLSRKRLIDLLILIGALIMGYYSKPQIIISIPVIGLAVIISLIKANNKTRVVFLSILGTTILLFLMLKKGDFHIPDYNPFIPSKLKESFWQYLAWHLRHTVAETIPWYWGVFNWLGVTLPRWVLRIQARILVVSAVGVIIYFIKLIKNKTLFDLHNLRIIFLLSSAGVYYFAVICWDYFYRQSAGFSFGMQGRYFFPTIVSQMLFILIGILGMAAILPKITGFIIKLLNLWWIIFSLIGLYIAATCYYQIWPFKVFLNQASQYKPLIYKSFGLIIILSLFIISLFIYIFNLMKINEKNTN